MGNKIIPNRNLNSLVFKERALKATITWVCCRFMDTTFLNTASTTIRVTSIKLLWASLQALIWNYGMTSLSIKEMHSDLLGALLNSKRTKRNRFKNWWVSKNSNSFMNRITRITWSWRHLKFLYLLARSRQ